MGLNTYDVCNKAFDKYAKDAAVLSVGVAGERGYLNSCIMVSEFNTGHSCRAAGRGGLGAVMGSKKIKAIIIEKPENKFVFPLVDKAVWDAARKRAVDISLSHPTLVNNTKGGTAYLVGPTAALKISPKNNFSGEALTEDEAKKYNMDVWMSKVTQAGGKTSVPCQAGCIVRCSNHYNGPDGKHITSSLEYETVALLGPNCGIYDFDDMARMDRLCDEMGIDTIDAGTLVAINMEVGKIAWGDAKAAIGLLEEMIKGTELGKQLGLGAVRYGQLVGCKRIPAVKGQTLAAYEPRAGAWNGYFLFGIHTRRRPYIRCGIYTGEARDSKLKLLLKNKLILQQLITLTVSFVHPLILLQIQLYSLTY
jgi:aldehyde:ferredoxin oxidoreductase